MTVFCGELRTMLCVFTKRSAHTECFTLILPEVNIRCKKQFIFVKVDNFAKNLNHKKFAYSQ